MATTARLVVVTLAFFLGASCCGKQRPQTAVTKPQPALPAASKGLVSRPHVTIVAFSDWQSVLKPCGCTEELQRGGIERNARFIADLRRQDNSVLVVHAGSLLVEDEAPRPQQVAQRRERMATFSRIIADLPIDAVALSSDDLKRGGAHARELYKDGRWPLLGGAAATVVKRAKSVVRKTTASGVNVAIIAVDPTDAPGAKARAARAQTAALKAKADGAQVVVALSNLGMRGSRRLARAAPALDVIVVGNVPARSEPVDELDPDDEALLLRAPRHGAYMSMLTLVPGPGAEWRDVSAHLPGAATRARARLEAINEDVQRFEKGARTTVAMEKALPFFKRQRDELRRRLELAEAAAQRPLPDGRLVGYATVGLPWSAPVLPTIAKRVAAYDKRVALLNSEAAKDPVPLAKGAAGYVGAEVCMACHSDTAAFAAKDLHSHAWKTLEKAKKTRDLDCVPCHSTGFGKPGGSAFANIDTFKAVQCEACHGPGGLHVAAPASGADSQLIGKPGEAVCLQCHTPEHAPRFEFAAYRRRLIVPGHGIALNAPK